MDIPLEVIYAAARFIIATLPLVILVAWAATSGHRAER